MEKDILEEIDNNQVGEVYLELLKNAPYTINVLNFIKSFARKDPTGETEFKIFCPKGEISSGIIIATVSYFNQCGYNLTMMYSTLDKLTFLHQVLIQTRKLKWENIIFEGLYTKLLPVLKEVIQVKNLSLDDGDQYRVFFLPNELCNNIKSNVPEDFFIRPLTNEDAVIVDKTWAYHNTTSYDYVRHSIVFSGGLGLVCKLNDQLVSWSVGVYNTVGMVHTLPEYRNRGCASAVVKAMSEKLISDNVQPMALIKQKNAISLSLFKKLGFVDAGEYCCMEISLKPV